MSYVTDAWDVLVFHEEKRRYVTGGHVTVMESGPIRATLQISVPLSERSSLQQVCCFELDNRHLQELSLDCTSPIISFSTRVDWRESHKMLKVFILTL